MDKKLKMIFDFQCNGCTIDHSPETCSHFLMEELSDKSFCCKNHSCGTIFSGLGKINIGFPKGFNRVGNISNCLDVDIRKTNIRFHLKEEINSFYGYDKFNVPVWAMEQDGFLFVRCLSPRINVTYVDVFEDGKMKDICPNAIDVGEFIHEID